MTKTQFRNASGLPNPEQYSTARDMMVLGAALQAHFPRYFAYFKTGSFSYQGRSYKNHNRLLGRVDGVDGIKTGYTRASGFNLITSVRRSGRRFVAVVMGGLTAKSRDQHMESLLGSYLPGPVVASTAVAGPSTRLKETRAAVDSQAANTSFPAKTREASALRP